MTSIHLYDKPGKWMKNKTKLYPQKRYKLQPLECPCQNVEYHLLYNARLHSLNNEQLTSLMPRDIVGTKISQDMISILPYGKTTGE